MNRAEQSPWESLRDTSCRISYQYEVIIKIMSIRKQTPGDSPTLDRQMGSVDYQGVSATRIETL